MAQDRSSKQRARTTRASRRSAARSDRSTAETPLSFDGVTVRYPNGDSAAIDRISFRAEPGERIALIGPSGAGKSTVLRVAAGLVLPTGGAAHVFGTATDVLGKRSNRPTRARIGVLTQDFGLVGALRVATNVAGGRLGATGVLGPARMLVRPGPIDEIVQVLERVGIAEHVWDRTDQLSGGQQQRTAIARTLFQSPDLFLADEPVSALDPARSEAVMAELSATTDADRALIVSMHDAPLALRHCDRIIALRDGKIHFDLPSASVETSHLDELYALEESAPS